MTESLGHSYMESENDLSIFDKKYYSFTINVSTNKIISSLREVWGKLDNIQQKCHLEKTLSKAVKNVGLPNYDYVFELTKKGHVHLHGIMYTSYVGMLMLQTEIHNYLGLPKVHPTIVFKFEETILDIEYFRDYMNKTNPDYHSSRSKSPGDDIDFQD